MAHTEIAGHFGIMAVGCILLFIFLRHLTPALGGLARSVVIGALLGAVSGVLMLSPIVGAHGATLDGRAGPAMLAGFVGGPVAAIVAALLGGGARMMVSGSFAPSALAIFALYCALGAALRQVVREDDVWRLAWRWIFALAALSVGAAACAALLIRPDTMARWWLREVFPLVALFNVAAVLFVGGVLREVVGVLATNTRLRDMRHQLETALAGEKQANGVKTRLLANLSHEFRTPLNAIIGLSSLMARPLPPAQTERYVREINASGMHLLDLVENLLDYSQIENGEKALTLEALDVAAVVTRAMNTMRPLAAERGVTLKVTAGPALMARGASRAMHQCLLNIMANAVRHSPEGGVVSVLAEAGQDGRVRLRVRNAGDGMPLDLIARMGEPFLRRRDATDEERRGGLGLAITKALMARQGGTLALRNRAGAGVEAELSLPACDGLDEPSTALGLDALDAAFKPSANALDGADEQSASPAPRPRPASASA